MNKCLNNSLILKVFANQIFNSIRNDKDYEHPFFLIEIIQRRKDNPNLDCPYKTLKWFAIYNGDLLSDSSEIMEEIVEFCKKTNSRAYFHVNVKDSRATVNSMLYLIGKWSNINNNTLDKLPECFYIAGRQQESNIKQENMFWVIDFDYRDGFCPSNSSKLDLEMIEPGSLDTFYEDGFINSVRNVFLNFITKNLKEEIRQNYESKCFSLKTVHGFHLILPPFDVTHEVKVSLMKELETKVLFFSEVIKEEKRIGDRIKKNNSTILWAP